MLLADVIRQVQREFGDDNEIVISQQDIVDWVNEARIRIARDANIGFASNTFTASAKTYTFTSSSATTIPAIRRVSYGTVPLHYIPVDSLDALNVSTTEPGTPRFYYTKGNSIYLFPVPPASDATTVTVETNSIYANLTTGSTDLQIPVAYHGDLVLFALSRAHHRIQDYQASRIKMEEFERNVSMRRYDSEHPSEEFAVVRDDVWDFGGEVW